MSKNIFKIIILAVILMTSATTALAQDQNSGWSFQNLPPPITDLLETFKKIQPNADFIKPLSQKVFQTVNDFSGNPIGWLEKLKNLAAKIDNWFKNAVGVSFFEIIKTFVNFFVWILELIIKLLKLAVSAI